MRRRPARQAGADRHTVAETLGERDDIRHDGRVLEGEPLTGTAHAGLDLVEHQQPAAFIAHVAQAGEIIGVGDLDAAFALDRLD